MQHKSEEDSDRWHDFVDKFQRLTFLRMMSRNKSLDKFAKSSSSIKSKSGFLDKIPEGYHDLPTAILLNIFQYFDERELQKTIVPVCHHWQTVASNEVLWKKVKFCGEDVPQEFMVQRIRKLKNLESISCVGISNPGSVLKHICFFRPHLLHLAFRHCPPVPEELVSLLIKNCEFLQTLDFGGTSFYAEDVFENVHKLQYLKSVNLSHNDRLTVNSTLKLALSCPNLEVFRLSKFMSTTESLKDEDITIILSCFYYNLTALSIDATTLTNLGFEAIMRCYRLQKLALYGANHLNSYFFTRIWQFLPDLTVLKVRNAQQINGQDVEELFAQGKDVFRKLKHLDFTGCCKITDNGIITALRFCLALETLVLKACKSLRNISEIANYWSNIRKINVAFCFNLDLSFALDLATKGLREIVVDEEQLESPVVEELQQYFAEEVLIYVSACEHNKKMKKL